MEILVILIVNYFTVVAQVSIFQSRTCSNGKLRGDVLDLYRRSRNSNRGMILSNVPLYLLAVASNLGL